MKAYTKADYQIHVNTLSAAVKTTFIKGKNKTNARFTIAVVIGREAGFRRGLHVTSLGWTIF